MGFDRLLSLFNFHWLRSEMPSVNLSNIKRRKPRIEPGAAGCKAKTRTTVLFATVPLTTKTFSSGEPCEENSSPLDVFQWKCFHTSDHSRSFWWREGVVRNSLMKPTTKIRVLDWNALKGLLNFSSGASIIKPNGTVTHSCLIQYFIDLRV